MRVVVRERVRMEPLHRNGASDIRISAQKPSRPLIILPSPHVVEIRGLLPPRTEESEISFGSRGQ